MQITFMNMTNYIVATSLSPNQCNVYERWEDVGYRSAFNIRKRKIEKFFYLS